MIDENNRIPERPPWELPLGVEVTEDWEEHWLRTPDSVELEVRKRLRHAIEKDNVDVWTAWFWARLRESDQSYFELLELGVEACNRFVRWGLVEIGSDKDGRPVVMMTLDGEWLAGGH